MLIIKVRNLKEGMKFDQPLETEDGQVICSAHKEIKKLDVDNWMRRGVLTVQTKGKRIDKLDEEDKLDAVKRELNEKAEQFKKEREKESELLAKSGEDEQTLKKATRYEEKINKLEVYEMVIEHYSIALNSFIKHEDYEGPFKEKLRWLAETIIAQMKDNPLAVLDIISFLEFGNALVSHLMKVAILSVYLGQEMELPYKRLFHLAVAGMLHDIGKVSYHLVNAREHISVSKETMNLPVTHPVYGYKTAKDILRLPEEACQMVLNHHEQLDGKGFPRRINGFKIAQGDKIVFLANMIVNLIWKNNNNGYFIPLRQIAHLQKKYPEKFDTSIVKKLLLLLSKDNPSYELQSISIEEPIVLEQTSQKSMPVQG